ncbi:hypothetical protein AQUCO_01600067v1 [Aquilegia coerulea]|uniref:Protein kinase domain-containing protein n=1 Tax=Aquilegia coerulea TaxID=218851 RepID=A0A2G5DQR5_AQUCA|nr:hypothetical protein AQUCO_01600067v1 [Aquilegia coerulea]
MMISFCFSLFSIQTGFLPVNIQIFGYNELRSATDNFDISNKIGRGGFGTVYKGVLRNGTQVAVKALSAQSKQGLHEFLTEIDTMSNVRNVNLVQIIGCCVEGNNRILVYEYVENNSLDRALLGSKSRTIKLDWGVRSSICIGTAKGLAFLHEELKPPIVHRDIKASNILLDKNFVPKIGDFGLAKLFPENITHISTRVAGTSGYLAPEYALRGKLTKKADVYSFGVLIIEIVSGRSNTETTWEGMPKYLLERTWQLYEERKLLELVDPDLERYSEDEVIRYIKVALFCTQAAPARRPGMIQVVSMLSRDIRLNEKELTAPGFFQMGDASATSTSSKEKTPLTDQLVSNSNITITQVIPR